MAKDATLSSEPPPPRQNNKRKWILLTVALVLVLLVLLFLCNSNPVQGDKCDLFSGEWIPNPSGPYYTNQSCSFIDDVQNCIKNGRPDTDYLYWRWKPKKCDLPLFDAQKFLDAMRDKSIAYIGDSIFRNQAESLVCILSQIEEAAMIYHDKEFKSRTWYFSSHNLTIADIWAPLLVSAETFENKDGEAKSEIQLHLDVLGNWTSQYHKFDFVTIAGGQWFYKSSIIWENNRVKGCHNCDAEKDLPELGIDYTYRKALRLALGFVTTVSHHRPLVMFRTWAPDHFEYGEWFSGGVCNRTLPYSEGEYAGKAMDYVMRCIEYEEFERAAALASRRGVQMKLMDTYHLTMLRPDGHPGPYRSYHPDVTKKVQKDCLHWCLPGPVDTYSELFMKMVLDGNNLKYAFIKDESQSTYAF